MPWRAARAPAGQVGRAIAFACLAAAAPVRPALAAAPSPADLGPGRRVLLLSSYGNEFSYFSQIVTDFRSDLDQILGSRSDFYQVDLELARFDSLERQAPFVDYLNAIFEARRPELVVTFGGPAARFSQFYRERLFPDVPLLYAAVDSLHMTPESLGRLDGLVPVSNDLSAAPEAALQLLPDTRHLAIVLGSSPLEKFWRAKLELQFAKFAARLDLIWLDGLSLAATIERVANLPPDSAVFLMMLLVDETGAAYPQDRVLAVIHDAANAPVFGIFDNQVGSGIVGGRLMPMRLVSRRTAEAAVRILRGAPPAEVRLPPLRPTTPVFDGRELTRWEIPESRLPAGSQVRFRTESPWRTYRWQIFGVLALLGVQSSLIALLFIHRARRHSAEGEVRSLHGRLLTTYEQERRRLARELHDDLTQRLARLAIDAAQVERHGATVQSFSTLRRMREDLVRLSEDVHTLSRQLHPSILDDLGLADALRSEAERFARAERIEVDIQLVETPPGFANDQALCLFRVAQEALRNIAHHALASRVDLILRKTAGGLELGVRDNGIGFDTNGGIRGPGLGHVSLRERLYLVGGRLEITSFPGKGTIVLAHVPLTGVEM